MKIIKKQSQTYTGIAPPDGGYRLVVTHDVVSAGKAARAHVIAKLDVGVGSYDSNVTHHGPLVKVPVEVYDRHGVNVPSTVVSTGPKAETPAAGRILTEKDGRTVNKILKSFWMLQQLLHKHFSR